MHFQVLFITFCECLLMLSYVLYMKTLFLVWSEVEKYAVHV